MRMGRRGRPSMRRLGVLVVLIFCVGLCMVYLSMIVTHGQPDPTKNTLRHNFGPALYSHSPKLPPVFLPGYDISNHLLNCNEPKHTFFSQLDNRVRLQKCTNQPMSVREFVCRAECSVREPELENVFELYGVAKYGFKQLRSMCDRRQLSALVWVRDNIPYVKPCADRVYGKHNWVTTQRLITMLLCMVKIPDVFFGFDNSDWAVPLGDSGIAGWLQPLPGIVRYVGTTSNPSLLFPTSPFVKTSTHCEIDHGFPSYLRPCNYSGSAATTPWNEKLSQVFWRGSSTGVPLDGNVLEFLPRPAFMLNFYGKPGYDLGFTGGLPPAKNAEYYLKFFNSAHSEVVTKYESQRNKYLMHMDGHTASWGLAWKFLSSSIVLWVPSAYTFREFYYVHLQPWKHYVPISMDFSNLESIRTWLLDPHNDNFAKSIAAEAKRLFQTRLRPEDTYCYIMRLMVSLSQIQKTTPTKENLQSAGIDVGAFSIFPEYDAVT